MDDGGVAGEELEVAQVRARDQDCSPEFGDICGYELLAAADGHAEPPPAGLGVDSQGRVKWRRPLPAEPGRLSLQVIAYDCAGKKSQTPAKLQLSLNKLCRPALKGKWSSPGLRAHRG